eukprot:scaffold23708_cov152-Cylindrotheca_fusiformis.AAC.3
MSSDLDLKTLFQTDLRDSRTLQPELVVSDWRPSYCSAFTIISCLWTLYPALKWSGHKFFLDDWFGFKFEYYRLFHGTQQSTITWIDLQGGIRLSTDDMRT